MVWTHYENLQVGRKASKAVIKAAYRSLSQTHHPDRNPGQRERANRRMQLINRAYEVLMNDELRLAHDRWIAEQEETKARTAGDRPRKLVEHGSQPVVMADYAEKWESHRRRKAWLWTGVKWSLMLAIVVSSYFAAALR